MARILIINDSNDPFRRFVRSLKQTAHEVFEVRSGDEALGLSLSIVPDLILISIVLPSSNGLEVAAKLRKSDKLNDTKIILLGYVEPIGIDDEPLASLVNGYVDIESPTSHLIAYIQTQLQEPTKYRAKP